MAEYIKRTDAVKIAEKYGLANGSALGRHTGLADCIARDISELPAADVAEVVRCKDCIRRYDTDECPMCFLIKGNYCEYTNENGFCDRGERKEGADNG